ncbi:MAG: hypothetical protein ABIO96_13400 [Nitrospiraceae bacterium]
MRTIISNVASRSESVMGRTGGKSMRALALLMGAVLLVGLPGCIRFGREDDSDTKASKNVAENAIYREVAEIVKLYRVCLQKNEDNPVKAKENCGMYKDAIRDLAPDNMRTIVAEMLDRLRDKSQKPSNRRDVEP